MYVTESASQTYSKCTQINETVLRPALMYKIKVLPLNKSQVDKTGVKIYRHVVSLYLIGYRMSELEVQINWLIQNTRVMSEVVWLCSTKSYVRKQTIRMKIEGERKDDRLVDERHSSRRTFRARI